jgi:acetyl esterase
VAGIVAGSLLMSAAQAADAPEIVMRKVVYKTTTDKKSKGDVVLNLHVFELKDADKSKPRPAIVFFFGGGWNGGTPSQFYPHCKYLAGKGMVAASAEYRVRSRNGTTPFECVKDGKSAVRYLRANAKELGIDPDRIASGGGSAGGHVGASTGTLPGLEEEGEDLKISSVPNAMVLFNPGVGGGTKGFGIAVFKEHKALSPADNIKQGQPPTIIFHGKADTTVYYEDVERFTKRMKEKGNQCVLVGFEGKSHGFFNLSKDRDSFIKSVTESHKFLAKLGYLSGDPTVEQFVESQPAPAPKKKRKKK